MEIAHFPMPGGEGRTRIKRTIQQVNGGKTKSLNGPNCTMVGEVQTKASTEQPVQ